jgi:hypothetical protein
MSLDRKSIPPGQSTLSYKMVKSTIFFKNWSETPQTKWNQCLPKTIKLDKWLKSSWIFENAEVMACNWCFRKILGVLNMHFATFCHFLKFSGLPNAEVFGQIQRFSLSGLWLPKFLAKYSAFNLSFKHAFCNVLSLFEDRFSVENDKSCIFLNRSKQNNRFWNNLAFAVYQSQYWECRSHGMQSGLP